MHASAAIVDRHRTPVVTSALTWTVLISCVLKLVELGFGRSEVEGMFRSLQANAGASGRLDERICVLNDQFQGFAQFD